MKNLIQGWFTTILGAAMMLLSLLQFYGFVHVPVPDGISREWQLTVGFTAGLILFLIPRGVIEAALTRILNKKTE